METTSVIISLENQKRVNDIGCANDSFNDIITKILDSYDEYQEIKDLLKADIEFERGESIRFSSLDELDEYLDK